jgi:Uma2 family endonuclease
MVLEVVSRSSVEKDTVILRQAYAEAGIHEYWLVDARQEIVRFEVLRLGRRGYTTTRRKEGWTWSEVFQHWFRLTQEIGTDGFPEYTLE